ncbi:hypothetical protein CTI14_40465, partial [Methylobacterium radiotolerans]
SAGRRAGRTSRPDSRTPPRSSRAGWRRPVTRPTPRPPLHRAGSRLRHRLLLPHLLGADLRRRLAGEDPTRRCRRSQRRSVGRCAGSDRLRRPPPAQLLRLAQRPRRRLRLDGERGEHRGRTAGRRRGRLELDGVARSQGQ